MISFSSRHLLREVTNLGLQLWYSEDKLPKQATWKFLESKDNGIPYFPEWYGPQNNTAFRGIIEKKKRCFTFSSQVLENDFLVWA